MTTQEMNAKIEAKVNQFMTFGYSKKEATAIIEKALKLVVEGKKDIRDVIDF
jgi:predicted RNase H-like HicB family nuclease